MISEIEMYWGEVTFVFMEIETIDSINGTDFELLKLFSTNLPARVRANEYDDSGAVAATAALLLTCLVQSPFWADLILIGYPVCPHPTP